MTISPLNVHAPSLRPKPYHADLGGRGSLQRGRKAHLTQHLYLSFQEGPLRPTERPIISVTGMVRSRPSKLGLAPSPDPYKYSTLVQNPASISHPLRFRSSRRRRVSSTGRPLAIARRLPTAWAPVPCRRWISCRLILVFHRLLSRRLCDARADLAARWLRVFDRLRSTNRRL